jgi:hypothetical protein
MSIETVEIRAFSGPDLVNLVGGDRPAIVRLNVGPQGDAGAAGTNGGSTSAWNYKAKTNATSGYPGNGYLLWNNATQTSATSIIVSHLNDDDTDLELLLGFIVSGQKLFIQDRDESANNQVWTISGTPTLTGAGTSEAYYTFPVTLVSSEGSAFTNNHQLIFGAISAAGGNSVTSATTSDGTAQLSVDSITLRALGIVDTATSSSTFFIQQATGEEAIVTTPYNNGVMALTSSTTGIPDKLTNGTIAGTLTINSTSYTYGSGAAAAHRTALEVNQRIVRYKAADTTRTSTTFADDPDWTLSLAANSVYIIDLLYMHTVASGTMSSRIVYSGTLSTTTTSDVALETYGLGGALAWLWSSITPPRITNFMTNQTNTNVRIAGTGVIRTATAGTLSLVWSAGDGAGAGSGNCTMKINSYIVATKIA